MGRIRRATRSPLRDVTNNNGGVVVFSEALPDRRIILFGGAGLVGQNLIVLMKERGYSNLVVVDKHPANTATLRRLHPEIELIEADMAREGSWQDVCAGAHAAVMLQAQIGGIDEAEFSRNNIVSTGHALSALKRHGVPYLVHISSSVVNSAVRDNYTETKKAQEIIVRESGIAHTILRPTLMFGWFDRKHLGWLSRLMRRTPVFPIPGSGLYMRQPLYVMDFCRVVLACLENPPTDEIYDISGAEKIDYVDMIHAVRDAVGARTLVLHIPYGLFWALLRIYALFDRDPPFTTKQLAALVTPDEFPLIPWWDIFGVPRTPFAEAARETFRDGRYADVILEF